MIRAPIPLIRLGRPLTAAAAVFALAAGLVGPPCARASTFNERTGRLTLEYADYAVNFDSFSAIPAELNAMFLDSNWNAISDSEAEALFEHNDQGLEGSGALVMGGNVIALELSLSDLASQFSGRRVEIFFWQRPEGTRFAATLVWVITDAVDPTRSANLSTLRFQPTGRATDDGWEEWTSGPVDFAAAGILPPAVIQFVDFQHNRWSWLATKDDTLRGRLDALEIIDLGPAAVPDATCNSVDMASACTERGSCVVGRCVDNALILGQPPLDSVLREDYLDRRMFEFRTFEGGRMPQSLMPIMEAAVESIRQETNPARFWAGLRDGISALQDGHASPPMMSWGLSLVASNLGICIHLGEADLLPQGGPAPLVFEVAGVNPVADQLEVGDVLAGIDGLPPYEWAAQLRLNTSHSGDPLAFDVVMAPRFITFAGIFGATLNFERCPRMGPNPTTCDATEVETIDIDLAQTLGSLVWDGNLPEWLGDDLDCDFRFRRSVNAADVRENHFIGYVDEGPIRTILINAVPSPYGDAENWWDIATEALDPPPTYLILDQRLGGGGSVSTVDHLMGLLLTEADFDRMEMLPVFERRLDESLWTMLTECISGFSEVCASYFPWVLHEQSWMPGNLRGVAGSVPVAVLNGLDVSGNDYTTKLATYRAAPTRIFGAGSTYGAFGPIVSLPGHLDESSGGSMQLWDTIFVKQPDDPLVTFATGVGIVPDDRVLQRQSDALQGIDTTIEAAKAWLLQR